MLMWFEDSTAVYFVTAVNFVICYNAYSMRHIICSIHRVSILGGAAVGDGQFFKCRSHHPDHVLTLQYAAIYKNICSISILSVGVIY